MKPQHVAMSILMLSLLACGGGGGGTADGGGAMTPPPPPGGKGSGAAQATCVTPPSGTDSGATAAPGNGGLQVTLTNGTIEGTLENGVRSFRSVRFAAPPQGCLRFRPPAPPAIQEGIVSAQSAIPICAQIFNGALIGEEDCLFLNVWAPNDNAVHPVMVLLHGGNINSLDGGRLAEATGTIVVAPNRRVGVFGTLALQQLVDESPDRATGTYAVQDTIAALRWVQRNIVAFGGDPSRVSVNGFSAGGSIACSLFAAPSARGLFSAASVLSGVCRPRVVVDASLARFSTAPPLKTVHAALITAVGCDTAANKIDCLRNTPVGTVLNAAQSLPPLPAGGPAFPVVPVVDGVVVVSDPYSALEAQVAGDFPVLAGSTRDDIRNLLSLQAMDDAGYRAYLRTNYGSNTGDALYALYPSARYPTPRDAAYMLLSDQVFGCPAAALARAASRNGRGYVFEFTRANGPDGYATHGAEFPYIFDTLEARGIPVDTAAMNLRSALQSSFRSLAAAPDMAPIVDAGDDGNLAWPEHGEGSNLGVDFGERVAIAAYREGRCESLDALVPP